MLLRDSDRGNDIGGIPGTESLRGVADGVEGAADNDDTCDVVVAWLGCSGVIEGLVLILAAAVLAPASSCRGRFLGPMAREIVGQISVNVFNNIEHLGGV